MPRITSEWIDEIVRIPDDSLLIFGRRDAQTARNWSKTKPGRDIFDDKKLAVA